MPQLRIMLRVPGMALSFGLLVSCNLFSKHSKQELSTPDFIQFDQPCPALPHLPSATKVCLKSEGASVPAMERQKRYIAIGINKWMQAVKGIDATISDEVVFDCETSSLKVSVWDGSGISTAGCGFVNLFSYTEMPPGPALVAVMDMSKEDLILQGTTLHELGHALAGLSDTYSGRQAGDCRPGQPESIMCWGGYGSKVDEQGWKSLYDDDIAGIRKMYLDSKQPIPTPSATVSTLVTPSPIATPLPTLKPLTPVPTSTPIPYGTSTSTYPVPAGIDLTND